MKEQRRKQPPGKKPDIAKQLLMCTYECVCVKLWTP